VTVRTLEGLRRQIDTATDLSSVVTTMKTLAAVSIHQYEQAVEALADYNRTIELGFQIVLSEGSFRVDHAATDGQEVVVIFGSDQGMCGQFNEEIVEFYRDAEVDREDQAGEARFAVGGRLLGPLLDAGLELREQFPVPSSVSEITGLVQELLFAIDSVRMEAGVSRLRVFYNHRISASSYQPASQQLLPISPDLIRRWRDRDWQSNTLPMFATERSRLISDLIQQHLFVSLFRACAESLASENASRIAAMQAAEKNIEERLEDLQRDFNQLRQSAITEELLDVVTGFEALSQQRAKTKKR
jgi:F-type H+-transporting ATPase subunit gamma